MLFSPWTLNYAPDQMLFLEVELTSLTDSSFLLNMFYTVSLCLSRKGQLPTSDMY